MVRPRVRGWRNADSCGGQVMRDRFRRLRVAVSVQRQVQLNRRYREHGQVPDALRSGSFDERFNHFRHRREHELNLKEDFLSSSSNRRVSPEYDVVNVLRRKQTNAFKKRRTRDESFIVCCTY